jgi:hypothetical protein
MYLYAHTHTKKETNINKHTIHTLTTRRFNIPRAAADAFFQELQKEAFINAHELLGEVEGAAQRLWTSAKVME